MEMIIFAWWVLKGDIGSEYSSIREVLSFFIV
jgi:hypothetical protein